LALALGKRGAKRLEGAHEIRSEVAGSTQTHRVQVFTDDAAFTTLGSARRLLQDEGRAGNMEFRALRVHHGGQVVALAPTADDIGGKRDFAAMGEVVIP